MHAYLIVRAYILITVLSLALAASESRNSGLDQIGIHTQYTEGEFENVEAQILAFQKTHGWYSRSDSLFIQKHLSVIYSANPVTREKGKYHMNRLLALDPDAKLVDMYISDEIDRIFNKVKEEFDTRRNASLKPTPKKPEAPAIAAAHIAPRPTLTTSPRAEKRKSGKSWLWWSLAGAGVVAAGATAYVALADPIEKTGPDDVFIVPAEAGNQ